MNPNPEMDPQKWMKPEMISPNPMEMSTREDEDEDEDGGGGEGRTVEVREQDRFLPIANIARIMKTELPGNAKIAKDAKESIQECVSEFISFITSEASDKCLQEKRKTINGDDLLWAMSTLGFDKYIEPLKLYLSKYRDSVKGEKPEKKPSAAAIRKSEQQGSAPPKSIAPNVSTPMPMYAQAVQYMGTPMHGGQMQGVQGQQMYQPQQMMYQQQQQQQQQMPVQQMQMQMTVEQQQQQLQMQQQQLQQQQQQMQQQIQPILGQQMQQGMAAQQQQQMPMQQMQHVPLQQQQQQQMPVQQMQVQMTAEQQQLQMQQQQGVLPPVATLGYQYQPVNGLSGGPLLGGEFPNTMYTTPMDGTAPTLAPTSAPAPIPIATLAPAAAPLQPILAPAATPAPTTLAPAPEDHSALKRPLGEEEDPTKRPRVT
ncbi:hypothetical protein B484DRAFT_455039 [Ochromonadaceae sp. CCMP2298]|nr:hypothetical protein B484DRAFT_455039 [Ochromonadaceae sp. CCMP2298]|mmetsp:Transcript_9152/g.20178  ORF Transcript_9152/g.20178 Transcript_9152/m.20178 type:complete len:426 (-) Transcript_9152:203-1480(-)